MPEDPSELESATQEVVFVLRVRAGRYGWQGQMQRLDGRVLSRLVSGTRDIYTHLDRDWRAQRDKSPTELKDTGD